MQILDGELDQELLVVVQGLQQAENMIRAGIERARFNVLQRTQRRTREPEAARVAVRDGVVYATSHDGAVEVPPHARTQHAHHPPTQHPPPAPPPPPPHTCVQQSPHPTAATQGRTCCDAPAQPLAGRAAWWAGIGVGGRWRCWRGWGRRCTRMTRTGRCSSWA